MQCRGCFYMVTASHFGTHLPSTGTQPCRIFNHCVPKEKRAATSCLHFSACVSPITVSSPFLCPVVRSALPSALSRSRSRLSPCPAVSCVLYYLKHCPLHCPALFCPALPSPVLPCPALPCSFPDRSLPLPLLLSCPCPVPATAPTLPCPALL